MQKNSFKIYNFVNEFNLTDLSQLSKDISIIYDTSQPTIKTSLYLDCGLAKNELNWSPTVSIEDGVSKTLEWWRKNIDQKTLKLKE